ncbi:MAG TPA: DUF4136 domain-containing protein [Steroidobacteraceae bacterium]|nr:DUF4136 domain-containing protein [Steroidobacteraceae bacterium]
MRTAAWTSAALSSLVLIAGCASGPKIIVDKDPGVDMTAFKTFGYFDQVATDRAQYTTIITNRLKQATRDQLERRGYRYTEESPDLRVNFYLKVVEKQEVRSSPSVGVGYGGFYGYRGGAYGAWASYPYDVDTVDYRQGTLSIDLVDAKKNALVWQGLAEGRVSEEARKNPGPAIDAVVAEIFANFPNGPGK